MRDRKAACRADQIALVRQPQQRFSRRHARDPVTRRDFDIGGLGRLSNGTQLAQGPRATSRRANRGEEDYTQFVKPEYELGCDVGERRSREFWQRRFGVTPD